MAEILRSSKKAKFKLRTETWAKIINYLSASTIVGKKSLSASYSLTIEQKYFEVVTEFRAEPLLQPAVVKLNMRA